MKRFICIIILLLTFTILYAKYIEPTRIKIYEHRIESTKIPNNFNGFKITHFSDLLLTDKTNKSFLSKTFNEINSSNSDIVVFTGDLLKEQISEDNKNNLITLLSDIKPKLYKYAILGDKDIDETKSILEESNFVILDNTSKFIFYEGNEPILLAGGNNLNEESLIQDESITYNYKIALIHKPDDFDKLNNNYDLVLAGHSLGGEIKLPFIGSTLKKSGAQKYTSLVYTYENSSLYISNGIGNEKTSFRFLNTPSINIYRLYNK